MKAIIFCLYKSLQKNSQNTCFPCFIGMQHGWRKKVYRSENYLTLEKRVQNPNYTLSWALRNQFAMTTFTQDGITFKSEIGLMESNQKLLH